MLELLKNCVSCSHSEHEHDDNDLRDDLWRKTYWSLISLSLKPSQRQQVIICLAWRNGCASDGNQQDILIKNSNLSVSFG